MLFNYFFPETKTKVWVSLSYKCFSSNQIKTGQFDMLWNYSCWFKKKPPILTQRVRAAKLMCWLFLVQFSFYLKNNKIEFFFKKTETGSNRPVSVWFFRTKTGLARFFPVWLDFFLVFFLFRFGSIRLFRFQAYKTKPNRSVFAKF